MCCRLVRLREVCVPRPIGLRGRHRQQLEVASTASACTGDGPNGDQRPWTVGDWQPRQEDACYGGRRGSCACGARHGSSAGVGVGAVGGGGGRRGRWQGGRRVPREVSTPGGGEREAGTSRQAYGSRCCWWRHAATGRRGAPVQWCLRAGRGFDSGGASERQRWIGRRQMAGENLAQPRPGRQWWRSSVTTLLRALLCHLTFSSGVAGRKPSQGSSNLDGLRRLYFLHFSPWRHRLGNALAETTQTTVASSF